MNIFRKIEHIWEYYRIQVVIVLVVILGIIYFIVKSFSGNPYTLVSAVYVGADKNNGQNSTFMEDFILDSGLDPEVEEVTPTWIDDISNNSEYQLISAMFLSGETDIFVATEDVIMAFSQNTALKDVSSYLSENDIEMYKSDLIYVVDSNTGKEYPCAIKIPEGSFIYSDNIYQEPAYIGIAYQSDNTEEALKLILYILEK